MTYRRRADTQAARNDLQRACTDKSAQELEISYTQMHDTRRERPPASATGNTPAADRRLVTTNPGANEVNAGRCKTSLNDR